MSIGAYSVGNQPACVTQKANTDATTLINAGTQDVYLNSTPQRTTVGMLIPAGYGVTIYPHVEVWAYTLVPDTISTLTVAEGVGPIFAARGSL